ncbi:MAG: hypothetical protein WCI77_08720 [Candidatus Omnitrophota bacterium]
MIKIFFLIAFCLACANCTPQKNQTNEKSIEGISTETIKTAETIATKTSTDLTTDNTATATVTVNAQIKKDNDPLIAEGKWMLSVYNPQAGTIEYYSGNGVYLGIQQI